MDLSKEQIFIFTEATTRHALRPATHTEHPRERARNLLKNKLISTEQFFQLKIEQMKNLLKWNVGATKVLIHCKKITFDDKDGGVTAWPDLKLEQEKNLICRAVEELILDATITYEAALNLTVHQRRALKERDTQERLRNGALTLADLDTTLNEGNHQRNNHSLVLINSAQSTHTASVHQSVSTSASRLYERYKDQIDLEKIISAIKEKLENLTENAKKEAALRGFERLTQPDYAFMDPRSQLSTKKLMALFDLALFDEENLIFINEDSKEKAYNNALKIWIETLYEIQRGYNHEESGCDKYICAGGTFNKFIERLCGVHKDCQIDFLTPETASLKFVVLSKEKAIKRYLELGNVPENYTDEFDWTKILADNSALVKQELFDEFRRIFSTIHMPEGNPEHPKLLEISDNTKYISISKDDIENYIKNEKGIKKSTLNVSFFRHSHESNEPMLNTKNVASIK